MTFGSVCSGIEAASVAWRPLGWRCAWTSEIEAFPSAVLHHHYPETVHYGDFTKIKDPEPVDLLVGGTPCQAFSVAGLRGGLDDARGNLTLEFLRFADRIKPRWIVWENVPGVLSIDGGRTFGTFLGGLAALGYGFAYRVLDAQYFGLAQRRKRVFVVGYLGDWRRAAAVLFDANCLSGNPPPSRETRKDVAPTISARTKGGGGLGTDFDLDGGLIAKCLNAKGGLGRIDAESETFVCGPLVSGGTSKGHGVSGVNNQAVAAGRIIPILEAGARTGKSTTDVRAGSGIGEPGDPMYTLQSGKQHAVAFSCKDNGADAGEISPTLRSMSHSGSHANAGGQVAVAFHENQRGEISLNDTVGALNKGGGKPGQGYPAVALNLRGREGGSQFEMSDVASLRAASGGSSRSYVVNGNSTPEVGDELAMPLRSNDGSGNRQALSNGMAVRRLTPEECEALQGFPRSYTQVPYRGKPAADGPRYKALGNSFAVPVVRWIGERIQVIDLL